MIARPSKMNPASYHMDPHMCHVPLKHLALEDATMCKLLLALLDYTEKFGSDTTVLGQVLQIFRLISPSCLLPQFSLHSAKK